MNNKGFSLIELLAVIALLAVILLIFTPNITKIIDDFKDNDKTDMLKKSAISAAKEYVVDGNDFNIDLNNCTSQQYKTIKVSDLIDKHYLSNNDWYEEVHEIKVTYDCQERKFINYEFID